MSPDGTKIVINEIDYVYKEPNVISEVKYLNKIHIYDFVTGQKVKLLDLSNQFEGLGISGISPDSSKLYLVAENVKTKATTTIIVDLKTYNIITLIPVEASLEIFFEE